MVKLISAGTLRDMAASGKNVVVPKDSILTPSAKDLAKELGLNIIREGEQDSVNSVCSSSCNNNLFAEKVTETGNEIQLQSDEIKSIVRKVLDDVLKPVCPDPKPKHVDGEKVNIPPFDTGNPQQKIGLIDVVTSREANLAAGFMTFDHSELPWYMTYDEVNYVLEGEYVLKIENEIFKAKPGDVIYIPKGKNVVFSSPTFAKVFYVTYPANWAECSKQE